MPGGVEVKCRRCKRTVLVPLSGLGGIWAGRARAWAAVVAGIALIGFLVYLLPFSTQANGMHYALGLPAHLGLAWGLWAGSSPGASGSVPAA